MESSATGAMILFNTMFQKEAMSDPNDPYALILRAQDTIDTYHRSERRTKNEIQDSRA